MLTSNSMCRPYIDTNNPQGMQLGRFKNRTPAPFEYIYYTLFPLCHLNYDMYPFLKDASFLPLFLFCAYDSSVLQNFKIFTHLLPNFSYKDPQLTEVTYHCINFNDSVRKVPKNYYFKCLERLQRVPHIIMCTQKKKLLEFLKYNNICSLTAILNESISKLCGLSTKYAQI